MFAVITGSVGVLLFLLIFWLARGSAKGCSCRVNRTTSTTKSVLPVRYKRSIDHENFRPLPSEYHWNDAHLIEGR